MFKRALVTRCPYSLRSSAKFDHCIMESSTTPHFKCVHSKNKYVKSQCKEFFRSRRLRASVNSWSRFLLTGQKLPLPLLKNTWSVPTLLTDRWKLQDSSGLSLWGAERGARGERVGRDTGPTERTWGKKTAGAMRRGESWVWFVV